MWSEMVAQCNGGKEVECQWDREGDRLRIGPWGAFQVHWIKIPLGNFLISLQTQFSNSIALGYH